MKRSIVFLFMFLLSLSLLLSSCVNFWSREDDNDIVDRNALIDNKVSVTGINVAGTYIELYKKEGVTLNYNIAATAIPDNATNKTLLYSLDNEDIATVSDDGILTITGYGDFDVTIQSEERAEIYQIVSFYIKESNLTELDINSNPLSLFGVYSVIQYGIGGAPDTNVSGTFTTNANKNESDIISSELIFNGYNIALDIDIDDASSMSYIDIAKSLYSYLNANIDSDGSIVFYLKASEHQALIDCGLLSSGQTLSLRLIKEYDLEAGVTTETSDENIISVTQIQVSDNIEIDRLYYTTYTLSPAVLPVNATDKTLTYKSDNESIITVSDIGVVSILDEGEASIIITSNSNEEISKEVKFTITDGTVAVTDISLKVVVDGKEVSLSNGVYTIYKDDTDEIFVEAAIIPEEATYKDVVYSSSNTNILSVDETTGQITLRRTGEAEVIATADKGKISESITLNVEAYKKAVTAILLPDYINMQIQDETTITPIAYPSDAVDSELVCASNDDKITVENNDGECKITTKDDVGEAIVSVSAVNYDVTEDMTIRIRKDAEEITITNFTFDTSDVTLYANYTDYTLEPTYEPEDANVETGISVKSSDTSIVRVQNNGDGTYSIIPAGEAGEVEVTVTSENGVTATKKFIVKKVMEVEGYYQVTQAKYSYGSTSVTFDSSNTKNFQGEFVIAVNSNSYNVQGRLQLTPSEPLKYYMFNNWRYIYENKEISLDSSDIYAGLTKEGLEAKNIKVTGSKTLEYTYTDSGFTATITLEKLSDTTKTISDRTIYMTDVDMINDPHSIEGYYEMIWFYGNPYTKNDSGWYRYQPLFSHSADDRPTDSDLGITYLTNDQYCGWAWLLGRYCYGGFGDGGTYETRDRVQYYKGAFAIKVDGTGETANITSIAKTQMNGHAALGWYADLFQQGGDESYKYVHAAFESLSIDQSKAGTGLVSENGVNALYVTALNYKGKSGRVSAYLAYRDYTNTKDSSEKNIMRLEHQFWTTHQFMYRMEKVSDRYVDLSTDKFSDDVYDTGRPVKPDAVVIEAIEELGGTITDIE